MTAHRLAAQLDLPADLASVTRGRHFVRQKLSDWAVGELLDDAELCVSELLTNAVLHAGTPMRLEIELDGDLTVRVRDDDRSTGVATPRASAAHEQESGRGLHIIERVSTRWGVSMLPDGKMIWFVLQPLTDDGIPGRLLSFERTPHAGHYPPAERPDSDGGYLSADMKATGMAG